MFRPRVIPVLLLKNQGLVKSVRFKNHQYIGDPINAVKIFNDLNADELIFLDILASREKRVISLDFVKKVGAEANMPFAVGGGITTVMDVQNLIAAGAEKVVINTSALKTQFIKEASTTFGSSTIAVCIDVKKRIFGRASTWVLGGDVKTKYHPLDFALMMQDCGAGEIVIQSIDNDGCMSGYDVELLNEISQKVTIPVVALGGAGTLEHMRSAYKDTFVSGLAAGSMFVYHGSRKGILISYPQKKELLNLFHI